MDTQANQTKKILLGLMPFWSPLTPPLGISVLKSYLTQHGFDVTTYDFNAENELWGILNRYFEILQTVIPEEQRNNFYMVAYDVLSNQLMAFLHKTSENEYRELVRMLMQKNFFVGIDDEAIVAMDQALSNFYAALYKSLFRVFDQVQPDIFGLSVYSTNLAPSLFALKMVKEDYPEVMTIMGGGIFADHLNIGTPNFEIFLKETEEYLDKMVVGEGEILFTKILSGELPEKRVYSLKDIDGLNVDLNAVAVPDFREFDKKAYLQMATYATRSCPFQCGFCSETVQWGKFRAKNVAKVVEEIEYLKEQYGSKLFLFGDSLVNPIINELSERLIERGTDVYWDAYLRADPEVCIPENAELWRKAGYYRARLGIESGSAHVLELMNKKTHPEQIKKAIKTLANAGVKTTTYWVVGYPGEREEDFEETLNLIIELKDDIYEIDWHPFYFFMDGQVNSRKWVKNYGVELLYPQEYTPMLLTQTWALKTNPTREEIFNRMNRMRQVCKDYNIPNPYSLMDIYQADKRWQSLHDKSGPTILDIHN